MILHAENEFEMMGIMAELGIKEDQVEASEMYADGSVTYWIAQY